MESGLFFERLLLLRGRQVAVAIQPACKVFSALHLLARILVPLNGRKRRDRRLLLRWRRLANGRRCRGCGMGSALRGYPHAQQNGRADNSGAACQCAG